MLSTSRRSWLVPRCSAISLLLLQSLPGVDTDKKVVIDRYSGVLDMVYDEIAPLASNIGFLAFTYALAIEHLFYLLMVTRVDLADIFSRLETAMNDVEDVLDGCSKILKMEEVEKSIQEIVI